MMYDSSDNQELNFVNSVVIRKDLKINGLNTRGDGLIALIPDYYKFVCSSFESLLIKICLNNRNVSLWLWI